MKIVCEGISINYNDLKVLNDISVETQERDFISILGPNGCGKTTLLKIMARALAPSSGKIYYEGDGKYSHPTTLIFQENGLFPWLNVMDNICFNLEMNGFSKKDRYRKAEEYIEKLGLTEFINYYPQQLSAGMRQKANLIRGLLTDSPVLLIDEIGAYLDIYTKLIIQKDIYRIWKEYKKTIIYVTHDIEEALYLSKTIWIMGKLPSKIIRKFDLKRNKEEDLSSFKNQIIEIIQREAKIENDKI